MNNGSDEEIRARVAKKFLELPLEKQQKVHTMMADLFHKLEREWKENPKNQGKPFSYVKMWDEFAARKGTDDSNKKK
jgi:hypothetical protein